MNPSEPMIPWPLVTQFVRQLNHDLRNHLNAIELQAAFLSEIVPEGEPAEEMKRLRGMTAEMGAHLQRLSQALGKIELRRMPYVASELVEDLRARVAATHPGMTNQLEWQVSLGEEKMTIDPRYLLDALGELIANALTHDRVKGAILFQARAEPSAIVFTLREPKSQPPGAIDEWGARPLGRQRAGHYALGLFRARSILQAHDGSLEAKFDPAAGSLTTTVRLPRARK